MKKPGHIIFALLISALVTNSLSGQVDRKLTDKPSVRIRKSTHVKTSHSTSFDMRISQKSEQISVYPFNVDYATGTTDSTVKTETSYVKGWGSPGGGMGKNGWMKFDVSGLPGIVIINWIKFHGNVANTYSPDWSITPMSIDPVTAPAPDIWNMARAGAPTGVAYAFNSESSTYAPGWKVYDLVNGASDDLANALGNGQDWFAIGIFERNFYATYYLEFDGWNETNVPYLEIDYTELDFGSIEGTVTELASGNPIDGATIVAEGPDFTYNVTTMPDGIYSIDPAQLGSYTIYCTKDGYNDMMVSGVMVATGNTTTQDFAMTSPIMEVDPLEITKILIPNATGTEMVNITNNGDGQLDWSASIDFLNDNSEDTWDLQFSFDVSAASGAAGNAGAECDGEFYYTTRWASNLIHKYDFDGNMIEEFSIPGVSGLRDLAFDGTYMYGGAAGYTIFEMNFNSHTLISSISSSQPVRSIAYDNTEDAFWVSNWDTDIDLVTKSGGTINTFPASEHGLSAIYGTAYDEVTQVFHCLWIFDQGAGAGTPQYIYQANLENLSMIGFAHDVMEEFGPDETALAGGLFMQENIYGNTISLGGLKQGTPDQFFLYEFSVPWLSLEPGSGILLPDSSTQLALHFNTDNMLYGTIYNADVIIIPDPDVGTETVEVELWVQSTGAAHVTGLVSLDGPSLYNIGNVTEVLVTAGPYPDYPDPTGYYDITAYPGTYDVTATLYGYETQTVPGVVVPDAGLVENVDFDMPTTYGRIMGTVTDIDTGDPIEDATVSVEGTSFETMTTSDGTYEIFIAEGTYDVTADHPTYILETMNNVAVVAEDDTEVNFQLTYLCDYCDASGGGDEWIDGVEIGDINNLGTGYSATGYADYTTMSAYVLPGMQYTITIHTGNFYTSDDYGVWVDWNQDCTFDPITENVVCESNVGADVNTFDFTVPASVTVGAVIMRVRLKWSGSDCGSPCGTTTYGEVEDYTLWIAYTQIGELEGTVTHFTSGEPVENAVINIFNGWYSDTTNAVGYYHIPEILAGTWPVSCTAEGYNPQFDSITITEDVLTLKDFALTAPTFEVDPLSVFMTIEPNEIGSDTLLIINNGDGPVDWEADIDYGDGSKSLWDLQFVFDVTAASGAAGNAGAECDGDFYYTTRWASNLLHKYDLDGYLVEEFSIPGVSGLRDLAYDGTYFYGGAAANTIYQMDFETQTLISNFSASQPVRSIAYDDSEDAFWVGNWDTDIDLVTKQGLTINTLPASTHGLESMYGSAFSDFELPYLWIFDQGDGGGTAQTIHIADLDAMTMTGLQFDVMQVLEPDVDALAGGLFIVGNAIEGCYSVGGLKQGTPDQLFMLEINCDYTNWLSVLNTSGTLQAGDSMLYPLYFDATGLIPAIYNSTIQFTTSPDVGSPVVDVTLQVEGLMPPDNLDLDYNCTDVNITWEMPAGAEPDSWNIYRNDTLIGNSLEMNYTDEMVIPESEHVYYITAIYDGEESIPSQSQDITVQEPLYMYPHYAYCEPMGSVNIIYWEPPEGCLTPDGFNVYRDGVLLNTTLITQLSYDDEPGAPGFYEYQVTAVYYFTESDPVFAYCIGAVNETDGEILDIYPNPVESWLVVRSDKPVHAIEIYNNFGVQVLSKKDEGTEVLIDMKDQKPGIYFLKIELEDGVVNRKVILK